MRGKICKDINKATKERLFIKKYNVVKKIVSSSHSLKSYITTLLFPGAYTQAHSAICCSPTNFTHPPAGLSTRCQSQC